MSAQDELSLSGRPSKAAAAHSSCVKRGTISPKDGYLTKSNAVSMTIGTGEDILKDACKFISSTIQEELIFVTCFWARSSSLDHVSNLLRELSQRALSTDSRIRVRICISSLSLIQKLFHTWSPKGRIYDPSQWTSMFGLPSQDALAGLDMQIKSVFIPPFSVMHSKFIVVDRKVCLLPSCNVSWEDWFEGCVDLRGPIVETFVNYWEQFWGGGRDPSFSLPPLGLNNRYSDFLDQSNGEPTDTKSTTNDRTRISKVLPPFTAGVLAKSLSRVGLDSVPVSLLLVEESVEAVFLPSPHNQNPRFRPFPWQGPPAFPRSPLNSLVADLLQEARASIYMQTPNVTSPPVLKLILVALRRGVSVHIVTNRNLMWLEQVVTAGTTTPACLRKLVKKYKALLEDHIARSPAAEEEGLVAPGALKIDYYKGANIRPVRSHLKLLVVDGETVVLGSGNMDRASWYTSQEVGVAIGSRSIAQSISGLVTKALQSNLEVVYG